MLYQTKVKPLNNGDVWDVMHGCIRALVPGSCVVIKF